MPIRSKLRTVLAQKDQLLEICPVARLGKPIICEGLSVPCDKPQPSTHAPVMKPCGFRGSCSGDGVRTNLLFTMSKQNKRQAKKLTTNLFTNDFFSSLLDTLHPKKKWWSRTGSNRRHPACKAGALPAELRPLIVFLTMQRRWWAWEDLNLRPHAYQARALTN